MYNCNALYIIIVFYNTKTTLIINWLKDIICFAECTLGDLWEEWDRGFTVKLSGKRTPPLRYLCSLPPKEQERWRGTTGSAMRTMLMRRRCLWMEMQSVFNDISDDIGDKEAAMLTLMDHEQERAQERLGLSKLPSNNQFADYLKNKNQKR